MDIKSYQEWLVRFYIRDIADIDLFLENRIPNNIKIFCDEQVSNDKFIRR